MRLLTFSIILLLGLFGIFYYFTYASFQDETVAFKVSVAFPLVAIILDYLAIRNIGKDEALELAKKSEKIQKWLEGQEIKKEIFVPGKMINFVV